MSQRTRQGVKNDEEHMEPLTSAEHVPVFSSSTTRAPASFGGGVRTSGMSGGGGF
eukprot:CAMPEP_0175892862 /NCGR_PEP_ID=MMETSP0107_2-20121207/49149_1 /TAXON_ID=195067 ORGANISM="Goniomonas pacifica, Strain CCMP1869" /NCGR_SAMPLE_ID=MMETSP0107_2 /ASSEMBLY_ACC=CAM_ASM_000203 /LENGTH=54 /DNA_ID=CAMNT_0017213845 /DNA_START=21 /DNA_END=182 /DNA_ORIENTATION=-